MQNISKRDYLRWSLLRSLPLRGRLEGVGVFKKALAAALLLASGVAVAAPLSADTARANKGRLTFTSFRMAGPYKVMKPVMIDSTKNDKSKYDEKALLNTPLDDKLLKSAAQTADSVLPPNNTADHAISLLEAAFTTRQFVKVKVNVERLKNYKLSLDGKDISAGTDIALTPATHRLLIKCLQAPNSADTAVVSLQADSLALIQMHDAKGAPQKKMLSREAVLDAKKTYYMQVSGDGLYYIQTDYQWFPDNSSEWTYTVKETKTNKPVYTTRRNISWVYLADHTFKFTDDSKEGRQLVFVDAQTLQRTVMCKNYPKDNVQLLPNNKKAIVSKSDEGKKADDDMRIYYHPDDRMPGWRNRNTLHLFDLETGITTPLTFGNRNAYLQDVSDDSRKALISVSTDDITHLRPTEYGTLLQLDLETMQVDTIIAKDYFLGSCSYSHNGRFIAIKAAPEFADRVGCVLPKDKYSNLIEQELFLLDLSDRKNIIPLTKDFDPSVINFHWSAYDGNIYFSAEDGAEKSIYRIQMTDSKKAKRFQITPQNSWKEMGGSQPLSVFHNYSIADHAPLMMLSASGATTLGKTLMLNTNTLKATVIEDIQERELADYEMPTVHDFTYRNSEGFDIPGFYLLPPGLDEATAAKGSYPMLVYYYGGCSPTQKSFSDRYIFQVLAARGYVIYFLEPRGCTGYGQEYAAWHGNTTGNPQTLDIIEGTKAFLSAHPYVNGKKLGCFGASYGGFMTQYLLTKTDMFSCGWSHAGISNHSSYWGYGYWGYTYSQISMPGTYPWQDKELYTDNSPLFNAHKIKTPLLLTHGIDDRNVPPIESSQLFTALQLLGTPSAYVTFQKEGHHVQNYSRLLNWQNTFMAWFDKWLLDSPEWWEELYNK